ncbi:ubiquinone biosynthesis protein UbiB [Luteimonas sp. MC1782]|uniref:ABC1 kinase family protein n=1 Tax=Luteimonas sp. MC1782 TaxID=2760305 RepID=UPI001603D907|nr:AarF/UbiB family protein [Luteimonas sp. MC1782]MBB1472376.1 ubiquinone biosynthesis protein UbiB [Luteimonas sp. MC1782]
MWERLAGVRDLGRLQEIASVLVRHGFGDLVRRSGMAGALERAGRLLRWEHAQERHALRPPERLRCALQELGPTFVKLGQVLSTRVDLLPPDWIAELSRLQNEVPALPWEAVRPQLVEDLGAEPEAVFARVEQVPVAAASLAQAHRAWLHDGTAVILKVRRPGITDTIEADLRLLARLVVIVESQVPDLRRYRPVEVVRQFRESLRRELDFAAECRHAERIAASFADNPCVVVPRVYWQWTSERLNVQDFIDGIPAGDLAAVDAAGLDRAALARAGTGIVLKMVLEDGLFHADPHPGNIFFLRSGAIALIDFGMVGHLGERRRLEIARLLHGMVVQDDEAVADILLDWSDGGEVDEDRLQADTSVLVDRYRGVPLKDLRMGTMLSDAAGLLRQHGLVLPPDLALVVKAFLTLEGFARQLDPDFDMASEAKPWLERVMLRRYAPSMLARRGRRGLAGLVELGAELPRDLRRLVRAARGGRVGARIDVPELKPFGDQVDRAASRLTIGVITAALIIGSSIVMNSVGGGVGNRGLMALGVLGFVGAAAAGVWIVYSIWKGSHHR